MAVVAAAAIFFIIAVHKVHKKEKRLKAQDALAAKLLDEDDTIYLGTTDRSNVYGDPAYGVDVKRDPPQEQQHLGVADGDHQLLTVSNDKSHSYVDEVMAKTS